MTEYQALLDRYKGQLAISERLEAALRKIAKYDSMEGRLAHQALETTEANPEGKQE